MKPRLLFVDDEETIRITLPLILQGEGFEVSVAASVPEALDLINREKFDLLLADLNIGQPGDGFTVVSAMRRTQPNVATFILTGYPDFESALQAIRQQVDDYLTKPADIRTLVETLRTKLRNPRHIREHAPKRVATVLQENSQRILQSWLAEVKANEELRGVQMDDAKRVDHLPSLLQTLTASLDKEITSIGSAGCSAASNHGRHRKEYGYTVPMLVQETTILQKLLSRILQEYLIEIDLSMLITDIMKLGENLNALLEQSIRAFQSQVNPAA